MRIPPKRRFQTGGESEPLVPNSPVPPDDWPEVIGRWPSVPDSPTAQNPLALGVAAPPQPPPQARQAQTDAEIQSLAQQPAGQNPLLGATRAALTKQQTDTPLAQFLKAHAWARPALAGIVGGMAGARSPAAALGAGSLAALATYFLNRRKANPAGVGGGSSSSGSSLDSSSAVPAPGEWNGDPNYATGGRASKKGGNKMRGRMPRARRFQMGGPTPAGFGMAPMPPQMPPGMPPGMPPQMPPGMPPGMTGIPGVPGGTANQALAAASMPAGPASVAPRMMAPGNAGAPLAAGAPAPLPPPSPFPTASSLPAVPGAVPGVGLGGGSPAGLAALRSAAQRRRPAAAAPPSGTYKRGGRVKKAGGGALRAWGDHDKSTDEDKPEPVEKKAKGGVTRKRPAGPKVSIAVIHKRPMPPPAPDEEDDAASGAPVTPPPGVPTTGMAKGGKWIQGMHMKKGALHEQMGVPKGEKIPEAKLEKAAQKGGKLGRRARLAETLKGMKKARGGACDDKDKMAKGGKVSKFNSTKAAPGNLPTHPGAKKLAAGGAAKERKGFPNTNPPPKRYASGGKVRGGGAAQRGLRFEGIY